ncbi:MAG TPA: metallopeptidase TldD-related protein [Gemmatimonadaceae bacterium]|nr:metallopeptidase TldD-related protein [Gemmatimonadaceae bacterium]
MSKSRRDFLKTGATVAAATIAGPRLLDALEAPSVSPYLAAPPTEAFAAELAAEALNAARSAGATYADVRIGRYRRQSIGTRERQITGVSDSESYGIGIRTIVNGAWGFAATSNMTTEGVVKAAREAVRISRAAKSVQRRPIELAPAPVVKGTWMTPVTRDPLDVPIEEKVALLFAANEAALRVPGVRFVNSGLQLLREIKMYANTEGTETTQTFIRVGPAFSATAIGSGAFQQYTEELAPRGSGWEYITGLDMPGNAAKWAEIAVQKLSAKSVEPGRYDVILEPQNLWLTIHESIGHPTELDRAMGYEANYAGTSFVAPPEVHIGKLKYGTPIMNIQGDRTQEGSLARCAWDDEGVAADTWLIIDKGVFKDYQTTREQAAWISKLTGVNKSHGCSFADSWDSVQFQRMPNVSLLPGEKDISLDDIVADTDRGIVIRNRGSWSIDHQRYNFQFSGQAFYEVRGGKIVGMLKDVAYQANTPVFWNSMDLIGGPKSYWLGGSFGDGKGQPSQSNSVSHGCPPARFRNVNIVNTGRES